MVDGERISTILRDLIDRVQLNRNYQKSDLLEILRLLKNYDLLKDPQLELKFARKAPPSRQGTKGKQDKKG